MIGEAVQFVRGHRQPVFLHLRTVRFLGHAGSDAEISYRKPRDVEADYDRDPLLAHGDQLRAAGVSGDDVLARYEAIRAEVEAETERLRGEPRLSSASEVMAPLATATAGSGAPSLPKRLAAGVSVQPAHACRVDQRDAGETPRPRTAG